MSDEAAPLRYVVLRHEGVPEPHFDLMFETHSGSMLRTWRAPRWPVESGDRLEELGMHRRAYLEYEGPVSGDRGWVRRVESGTSTVVHSEESHFIVSWRGAVELELVRESNGTWRSTVDAR